MALNYRPKMHLAESGQDNKSLCGVQSARASVSPTTTGDIRRVTCRLCHSRLQVYRLRPPRRDDSRMSRSSFKTAP